MAGFAGHQAVTVAANIKALAAGSADLVDYHSVGTAIVIPIGPGGGAGQFPGQDEIVGRDIVSTVKGRHMMVDRYRGALRPGGRGGRIAAVDGVPGPAG